MIVRHVATTGVQQLGWMMQQTGNTTVTKGESSGDDLVARTITSVNNLEAIAPDWRALAERQTDPLSYFQSADWCLSWCHAAHAATGRAPDIIVQTFWQGERLVCIVPLMVERKLGLKRVVALGMPESQYSGCMIDPQLRHPTMIPDWIAFLRKDRGYDVVVFDELSAASALVRQTKAAGIEFDDDNATMVMDLSGFDKPEDIAASQSRTTRKNHKNKLNRLSKHGEVTLDVLMGGTSEYRASLRKAIDWKRNWLEVRGLPMATDREDRLHAQLAELPSELARDGMPVQGAIMLVLRVGGQSVAKEIGFVQGRHYYSYLGAYDPDWTAHSVGTIEMNLARQWAVEQGIDTYDFLGSSEYKSHLTNHEMPLVSVAVPLSLQGWLYAALWLRQMKPVLYRTFHAMGPRVKRPIKRAWEAVQSFRGAPNAEAHG